MKSCQLVNSQGIVIARWSADLDQKLNTQTCRFLMFETRMFELKHEHGGGPLTWYEVSPYVTLYREDCEEDIRDRISFMGKD